MTFTLTIECDNAAFCADAPDDPEAGAVECGREVARILIKAAQAVEAGNSGLALVDSNGNRVGICGFND